MYEGAIEAQGSIEEYRASITEKGWQKLKKCKLFFASVIFLLVHSLNGDLLPSLVVLGNCLLVIESMEVSGLALALESGFGCSKRGIGRGSFE